MPIKTLLYTKRNWKNTGVKVHDKIDICLVLKQKISKNEMKRDSLVNFIDFQ